MRPLRFDRSRFFTPLIVLASIVALQRPAAAAPGGQDARQRLPMHNLKLLSIEQLMTIDVTTANRREEPLGDTAAAVSVITRDDIRRSGVTTVADALTLTDGVEVARFNNGTWAITARGFNQNASNKLLVMVDGRAEYSPLFTGVFWNTVDYVLEDIERIEVIRGPGAVLWGANAVNGVVNIITRSARDTVGGFAAVTAGSEDRGIAAVRYGATLGAGAAWRVYGKFADRDAQKLASGASSGDGRQRGQTGFRIDGGGAGGTSWLVKGDIFHSRDHLADRADGEFTNAALQARWSRTLAARSVLSLQSYYRREYRRVPLQLTHRLDTVDFDAQHAWTPRRHQIVWGGGFRLNQDATEGGTFRFDPPDRSYRVSNVFAQDEIALIPDRLFTTLGAKWEHNAFSGGAFQPNVRARLRLRQGQTMWGAVSRAIRRPTRFEDDLVVAGPGGITLFQGSDAFAPESLVATELGYRAQPARALSVDLTVFRHVISDLRSQEAPLAGAFPITIGNTLTGRVHGVEAAVNVQPVTMWRTHVSYTWLDASIQREPGSRDVGGGSSEANDPRHQLGVRSSLDLPRHVELDAIVRAVDALPNPVVPAFTELTLRVGWTPAPRTEVWFTGQDLLHDHHPEFGAPLPTRVEFERSLRGGIALRF